MNTEVKMNEQLYKKSIIVCCCNSHCPFFLINLFIYLFLAVLGLHCCTRAFSSCGEQGLLFLVVCRLLISVACLCWGAWALGTQTSVVVAHRFSSCSPWALECKFSSCGAQA